MLQEVQSRPLPIDHTSQVSFMQVVDALLNSVAQAEFEPAAESTYETQIFPAIFDRLSQRNDIAVIKRLFRMLYDRVRGENAEKASIIISWLQPPLPLLESALFGLEDTVETQYKAMLGSISSAQLSMEGMQAASCNRLWPKHQAFVVGLRCAIEEFCEFFWRLYVNNVSGMHNRAKPMNMYFIMF
jgi:hypothetical protein